jgi:hypothetical protein
MKYDSCTGIYQIKNLLNGHTYIGSGNEIRLRRYRHFYQLRHGFHPNKHLQRAWNLYSQENFIFDIILICEKFELLRYEQELINRLKPEYNISPTAGSILGYKVSEETKEKQRKANIGQKRSDEARKNMSEAQKGHPVSKEARQKMSDAKKGKAFFTGHKHSEKTKLKMSKVRKGKLISDNRRQAMIGRKLSQETKDRIGNANRGKIRTEESKQRYSLGKKEFYRKKKLIDMQLKKEKEGR